MPVPEKNLELDQANLEDLIYLSEFWKRHDITNAQIRHSSGIVRRLLIAGDIHKSAGPRGIRLQLESPDNKAYVRAAQNGHLDFFMSGGTNMLGVFIRGATATRHNKQFSEALEHHNPEAVISLKVDSFLNQAVFYFQSQFISRRAVLLYVANKAAGPHFDTRRDGEFAVLDRIRSVMKITLDDGIPGIGFDINAMVNPPAEFVPNGGRLDPVFLELCAAIRYLTESECVAHLLDRLRAELHA